MGRLIDSSDVYNAIQITADNFGAAKHVVETNMIMMLSKIPTVEGIPKDQYEARLKADLKAILVELQLEIEEEAWQQGCESNDEKEEEAYTIRNMIQSKIDKLKEDKR